MPEEDRKKIILNFKDDLLKLNQQRRWWLILSLTVVGFVGYIIVDSTRLASLNLLWMFGSMGMTAAIVWWYWTMLMVRITICHQYAMIRILNEIINDIGVIKVDVKILDQQE